MSIPQTIYFNDYTPSDYGIDSCQLEFIIENSSTRVDNVMEVIRQNPHATHIQLNGEMQDLELLWVNDVLCDESMYTLTDDSLTIALDMEVARIRVITRIYPDENTALEGLYRSGGIWCTQNEPEGFRRITYFLDRPDVMTRFTTKIIASAKECPVILGNGNLAGTATLENGKHVAIWEDPIPKPAYLFALVAGDLGSIHDVFVTMSGKKVALAIYCDKGNENKCHHAMRSLKKSMTWDEEVYGREYDLDIYNIVAVDSFNMGAMENKGLNIFNSHYVLADEQTATDMDFMGIESVIAHEYFHNWTGNRITCRNWFELTLKEGLTVFRDQCFSADMNSQLIQRLDDVRSLRERQYVEDAGPTAHPIKPDHYIEINNFYTATVYEKGAEVIRMLHTLLGEEGFRRATDLYFENFDGQAVGTEEFLWAMQQESPIDLTQFERWYSQERTPTLRIKSHYDSTAQTLTLTIAQVIPKNTHNLEQLPYAMPFGLGLIKANGEEFELKSSNARIIRKGVVWIEDQLNELVFENITEVSKLSLNRHFSAPVRIECDEIDHSFLMAHDSDGFVRYEAAQQFAIKALQSMIQGNEPDDAYVTAYGKILEDTTIDRMYKAQLLELPTISMMMQFQEIIDVDSSHKVLETLKRTIAHRFSSSIVQEVQSLYEPTNSSIDAVSMGKRALKNRLMSLWMSLGDEVCASLCKRYYDESTSMTDRLAMLDLLENYAPHLAKPAFENFYARHSDNTLVMNKYFALLASSRREGTLQRVIALQEDKAFDEKVPNLVRALIGSFARNLVAFHDLSGSGYDFVADKIIEVDGFNPQIASGLAGAFKSYEKLSPLQKGNMGSALERIKNHPGLSNNVNEIVSKVLNY
ncbi:MAG TPA: aminopeptidase N [Sulfuricurvum sp.]|nr:MAG: aminopeptidase N [Campylobacterales bacterium 16-40-21]OZA03581.1 MAG: aminopeptidase N [Sulfuricurvum sp. 17-40-25]HQS65906.1 aminopeptidase N [Sulfuricurvum sp.]